MEAIRTLWASTRGDPVFMRRLNGWLTVFWIAMIPVSIWTHWISSITYVAALTLWGLVSGHWSAWQAARVEVKQEVQEERHEEVADQMLSRIAEQTADGTADRSEDRRTDAP